MNDAVDSARTLVKALSLRETALRAVPEYFQLDRDPHEILGEIFTALRREAPDDYMVAFKSAVQRRCVDCDEPARRRNYCNYHYQIHYRAGDFE